MTRNPDFEISFNVWTQMTKQEFVGYMILAMQIGTAKLTQREDTKSFEWDIASKYL